MSVYTTRINITIPYDFLKAVDVAAEMQAMNRSTFIRVALKEKMGLRDFVNLEPFVEHQASRTYDPDDDPDLEADYQDYLQIPVK